MNLATKITVTRIVLTPFFFLFYMLPIWTGSHEIVSIIMVIILFLIAELTDALDGHIARKYNMVTDLGKVLDPFSDVLSRLTYFYCFTLSGVMASWMFLIIFYREISMMLVRMISMKSGVVLAANIWGKVKAVFYFVSSIFGLAVVVLNLFDNIENILLYTRLAAEVMFFIAMASSVMSFVTYIYPLFKKK